MSWAIYQHVAHRISNRTLQELFREFFGLAVANPEIHELSQSWLDITARLTEICLRS